MRTLRFVVKKLLQTIRNVYRLSGVKTTNPYLDALDAAIAVCGSQSKLAERIGLKTQGAVHHWRKRNNGKVPAEQVLKIEAATSGKVTRYQLRPDLYPLTEPVRVREEARA